MQTVGQFIKERRETLEITQKKISEVLGWSSAQFVSNIERGVASLPASKVRTLARLLKTSPETLVKFHVDDYTKTYTKQVFKR